MNSNYLLLGMLGGTILYFALDKLTPERKPKSNKLLRDFAIGGSLKWEPLARKYSAYGVDKNLILAVIAQESSGNRDALGKAGEIGLMQILKPAMTDVNQMFGYSYDFVELWTPEKNINVGSKYLGLMMSQTENVTRALQSYNAGATTVKNNPNASIDYARSVLKYKDTIEGRLA